MSSRRLQEMSSRRLQDMSSRRLARCLQDVLEDVKLLRWRRVEDVFKTNKCLLGDTHILYIQIQVYMNKLQADVVIYAFKIKNKHYMKSGRIRNYSGTYFPTFGLNTERYSVTLCIQSECGKIRTRITPNTDTLRS